MEYLLPQPAERRPAADTLAELRFSCRTVLESADFGPVLRRRLAELLAPDHVLLSEVLPLEDLAVAVLDPIRDPDRYGGELEHVEGRWQQLGAWLAGLGMPADSAHHLVRAVARTARDVSGEEWDSASSSGWSALQLWMQGHLDAGAELARSTAPEPDVDEPGDAVGPVVGDAPPIRSRRSGQAADRRTGEQTDQGGATAWGAPGWTAESEAAGRRPGAERLAAVWSDAGASTAAASGGAPPGALRAVHRALGEPGGEADRGGR